ncbi:metallophosphoesterase [Flexivirga caeni]|uniref:Calcineurin-like phosphoesterase domain-containing protein n=1 Tax=Flexivirga caeni TaxID=2294115 RepID=A0A3M9MAI7_9MICO|nr:metallophosphoesterase [Flexivirga caeni]RNI21558.1 hypothetical protein EFY87_10330 [Flexivirga caeni]
MSERSEHRSRVAVIGDVGGHLGPLQDLLVRLGVSPGTWEVPPGLIIVQVGDLVHRGPDSPGVVEFVDRLLVEQPGRWVQLAGNHEAQYLREPDFDWPELLVGSPANSLVRWWNTAKMVAAAVIETPDRAILATHAGLTRGYWEWLGSGDARHTAQALHQLGRQTHEALFRSGTMLGGGAPDPAAGPLWAEAGSEVASSWWSGEPGMPFDQVHGHSSVTDFRTGRPRTDAFGAALRADTGAGIETITLPSGARLVGCDPGHGQAPQPGWEAWIVDDACVVVPR